MKKTAYAFFIVFFLASLSANIFAQSDNRGTDFWVCFPQNAKYENAGLNFKLYITGDQDAKGIVTGPESSQKNFALKAGEIISVDIDTMAQVMGSDLTQNLGIHVVSDQPVAVYGLSNRKASTDSYVAYPTNVLGTAYRGLGYDPLGTANDAFTSQITFVATDDNTKVTVALTANTKGGRHTGETFSIQLQKGQVYQLQGSTSLDGRSDLTGTLVTSDKPIAFFTGHTCAEVPRGTEFCDQLLEEEPPVSTWGKQFFLSKMLGKDWYVVRVVANENDTKIFFDQKFIKSLAAGEFYEAQHVYDNVMITSDKPILVGQYATSASADTVKVGDPFMMLIAPTEQFLSSYRFVTPIKGSDFVRSVKVVSGGMHIPDSILSSQTKLQFMGNDTVFDNEHKVKDIKRMAFKYDNAYIEEYKENASTSGWQHYINIIVPIGAINSLRLDSNGISKKFSPIGITNYAIGQLEIPFGSHTITADRPFGLYSYGFGVGGDNYDSYGNSAGQRVAPIERTADTSKPTLEMAQSDTASDVVLIARDDRINDLGLQQIIVIDSSNTTNSVYYPLFDPGAPEVKFRINKVTQVNCLYIKLQDFAKNQSYFSLCPVAPTNSMQTSDQGGRYSIMPVLLQQQQQHETYPIDVYPSPAKFGQPVTIDFTNATSEIIAVQVFDEGSNLVAELQKKQITGAGQHSLTYLSDRYATGNYFLRFTAYSQNGQLMYQQDARIVVIK